MEIFRKIKTKIIGYKNYLAIAVFIAMLTPTFVFAKDATDLQIQVGDLLSFALQAVIYASWIVISLMGDLFSNDYVMHPQVVPTLRLIWTILRNFVNMSFIIYMIYLAYQQIFSSFTNFEIKNHIVKMAIALILVNFSWLGVTVLVDASSIATHTAFSLVDYIDSQQELDYLSKTACQKAGQESNCNIYSIRFNKEPQLSQENRSNSGIKDISNLIFLQTRSITQAQSFSGNPTKFDSSDYDSLAKLNKIQPTEEKTIQELVDQKRKEAYLIFTLNEFEGPKNVTNQTIVPLIAQSFAPLQNFIVRQEGSKSWGELILDSLFSFSLALIVLLSFLVMGIILIVRIAYLWGALMLSPLLVFMFLDEGISDKIKEAAGRVTKYAFAPAAFGLVLSFTFIVIGQLSSSNLNLQSFRGQDFIIANGALGNSPFLIDAMLLLMTIVLLWMGILAVLSNFGDAPGKFFADSISKYSGMAGSWAANRALDIDFVPVVSQGGVSTKTDLRSLKDGAKTKIDNIFGERHDSDRKNLMSQSIGNKAASITKIIDNKNIKSVAGNDYKQLVSAIKNGLRDEDSQKSIEEVAMKASGYDTNAKRAEWYKMSPEDRKQIILKVTDKIADKEGLGEKAVEINKNLKNLGESVAGLKDAMSDKKIRASFDQSKLEKALTKKGIYQTNKSGLEKIITKFEEKTASDPNYKKDIYEFIKEINTKEIEIK